jgi:hypothetical protein
MTVVDGNGLPIGLHLDSAQPHEITLAETTLNTIRVPNNAGVPKPDRKSWWQTKVMIVVSLERNCAHAALNPLSAPLSAANANSPNAGVRSELDLLIVNAGKSNVVLLGWTIVVVWWCVMNVIFVSTRRFVLLPLFSGALIES